MKAKKRTTSAPPSTSTQRNILPFPVIDTRWAERAYLARNVSKVFRLWEGVLIEIPRRTG